MWFKMCTYLNGLLSRCTRFHYYTCILTIEFPSLFVGRNLRIFIMILQKERRYLLIILVLQYLAIIYVLIIIDVGISFLLNCDLSELGVGFMKVVFKCYFNSN